MPWDVFVSYASEDQSFARRIAEGLRRAGLDVWFDEFALEAGDSLRRSIDKGLKESRYGVVILSPNFFRKEWPQRELDGLASREDGRSKILIPVWYNVTADDVRKFSPTLADKLSVFYAGSIKGALAKLLRAIEKDRIGGSWAPQFVAAAGDVQLTVLPFRPTRSGKVLCIGRFPITNAQYKTFVTATTHRGPVGENYDGKTWNGPFSPWEQSAFAAPTKPVVCVDFRDALQFCKWASSESTRVFLPSAEVWDIAAAEGRLYAGVRETLARASLNNVVQRTSAPLEIATEGVRDNLLGVSDLFGNIWEWCGGNPYERQRPSLAILASRYEFAPAEAELRGGGFLDDLTVVHPALRSGMLEDGLSTRHSDLGFRVAGTIEASSVRPGLLSVLTSFPEMPESVRILAEYPQDIYEYYDYGSHDGGYYER